MHRVKLTADVYSDGNAVYLVSATEDDLGLSVLVDEADAERISLFVPVTGDPSYFTLSGSAEDLGTLGRYLVGVANRAKKGDSATDSGDVE